MRQIFKSITKKLAILSLAGLLVGQGSGYLAQKLMVENNIRERVRDALSKIVDNNNLVIINMLLMLMLILRLVMR